MDKAWAERPGQKGLGRRRRWQGVSLGSPAGRFGEGAALSRKVENDEADLLKLIDEALSLFSRRSPLWAVDQPGGGAALLLALLLALLWERDQRVLYLPALNVDRARDTRFPNGESKTDARDARVIADQARMRPDLKRA